MKRETFLGEENVSLSIQQLGIPESLEEIVILNTLIKEKTEK